MPHTIALGQSFEIWQRRHEQDEEHLAGYLDIKVDGLARLAAATVSDCRDPVGFEGIGERWDAGKSDTPGRHQVEHLAGLYGADRKRLYGLIA